ncbi:MAG: serine/threonine-protein kinase, partial [Gaiellales bacterium]
MTDSVSADPRIGSVIAGYRVERLLGRGGMSVVYLAEHLRLKRKVALKLLAPELAADEAFRERFLRESELAASLDHPNVIPIYDADEAGGVLFIAMRYVEGGDLAERLTGQGRLEPAEAVSLLGRVADALDAAHGLGLIHRDVKPGNVLISDAGHVYLSDFGLTRRSEDDAPLTESGQFVGTMDYVAPEQIESKGVSGQTDVYALSCVLFECLTGERPFRGDSTVGLLFAHLQNDPPSASQLDPELPSAIDPVLVRGMAKSPEARYPTCGELISEAQGALGLSGEIAQPVVASRWSRRRLLLVAAVLAAVVAVAAAVPAILLTGSGETSDVNAPTLELTGTSLQRIDAETNELAATIGFTRDPEDDSELRRPVAVDDEGAWVLLASDVLAEIDVSSNTVEGTADTRRSRL